MGERTSEYWQERFRQLEESQHDTSVQTVQEIEQEFRRAEQALDGKINAWYQRFAANNGISMVEARRLTNWKSSGGMCRIILNTGERMA